MNNIDEIFKELESALLRIEILIFFSKNPYTMDTIHKFSGWLKRHPFDIQREFDYFTRKGIVEKIGEGENAIYSYTSDIDIVNKVNEFVENLAKRKRII